MDVLFVKWVLVAVVFLFAGLVKNVISVDVDDALTGTITGIEGDSIILNCDLSDTDTEYIWFSNPDYFLTRGPSIIANLPPDIANRIAVTCTHYLEACYLKIRPLLRSDAGNIGCGYQEGDTRTTASSAELVVLEPPECSLWDRSFNPISSDMVNVGDQVQLGCILTDGNPRPTVYIARDGLAITPNVTTSFTEPYTLSQNDEGSTFTCVMTHPALLQPRTCTLFTLRRQPIPTVRPQTTFQLSQRMTSSQYLSTTKRQDITVPSSGQTSMDMSTITIIIVVIVIVIVIIITTVVFGIWFIQRRRSDKDEIKVYPPRASQDPTMNLVAPHAKVSTDYDFVNIRDSNENLQESTINSNHFLQDETVNTTNQEDAFPVYAKPEKPGKNKTLDNKASPTKPGEYENMPPVSNGNTPGNTAQPSKGDDGIMYAELELSVDANTNSTIISGDANNATVYADIRKT